MQDPILETRRLSKDFGGFVAVDAVDLCVRRGQIHALIGPNGAGKTTLFNLLTRFISPSSGSILYKGRDISRMRPQQVARLGISRSFQISAIFPDMSVLENVCIALQRGTGLSFGFWRSSRSLDALIPRAMELLDQVGLADHAGLRAASLPYGHKRALELATTLASEPELLLLDEPTQGLGSEDIGRISRLILQAGVGRTILLVEHNMKLVASLADYITVLVRGAVLAGGDYAAIARDPAVIQAYMGSDSGVVADPDVRGVCA